MSLYKYMREQHLVEFLRRGSLKIGTLHEYRRMELYGPAIGDDSEGIQYTEFNMPGGGIVENDNSREAKFFRKMFTLGPSQQISFAPGAVLNMVTNSPDMFIYCASHAHDPAVMQQFGGECLEIVNPEGFFKAISHAIRHKAQFVANGPIKYVSRTTLYTHPHSHHPAFMKEVAYAYQNESRVIWAPKRTTVQPIFLTVPAAVKHCRRFKG